MTKKNLQELTWDQFIAGFKEAGVVLRTLREDHGEYRFLSRVTNGSEWIYLLPEHYESDGRVTIGQVMNACRVLRLDHQSVFPEHVINF